MQKEVGDKVGCRGAPRTAGHEPHARPCRPGPTHAPRLRLLPAPGAGAARLQGVRPSRRHAAALRRAHAPLRHSSAGPPPPPRRRCSSPPPHALATTTTSTSTTCSTPYTARCQAFRPIPKCHVSVLRFHPSATPAGLSTPLSAAQRTQARPRARPISHSAASAPPIWTTDLSADLAPDLARSPPISQLLALVKLTFEQRRKMLRQSLKRLLPTAVTAPPDEWLRLRPEQLEPLQFARPRGGNMRASRGLYRWDTRRPHGPDASLAAPRGDALRLEAAPAHPNVRPADAPRGVLPRPPRARPSPNPQA